MYVENGLLEPVPRDRVALTVTRYGNPWKGVSRVQDCKRITGQATGTGKLHFISSITVCTHAD